MEHSKTARAFLGMNAAFSLLTGAALLIAAGQFAELLFANEAAWQSWTLRILGVGLILFGVDLIFLATDRFVTKAQVTLISFLDSGWVLGSAFLLVFAGSLFTGTGATIVAVVAAFVTFFALGQYLGARKILAPLSQASVTMSGGKILAKVSRKVDASQDIVWRVMSDHPGYADVADNISKVEVVEGDGIGMQRRCYGPKGENWLETCDYFEAGRGFGFRIHTEADDYPYPISDLHGEWVVESNGNGSEFAINIEAEPKGNFLVQTLFKTMAKRQFKAVLADLADAWAARMEREARA